LIALLSELPEAEGLGVDLSEQAIKAASTNAGRCGIGRRAEFRVADLAHEPEGPFDIVVANPPYIPSAEIERLGTEVRDHDPRLALDGGSDGLDAYRAIAARSKELLRPGGLMAVEVGASQAQDVAAILVGSGQVPRRIVKDIAGIDRVVVTVSSQGETKHP
jgi:release factor glutamine methyltransferase